MQEVRLQHGSALLSAVDRVVCQAVIQIRGLLPSRQIEHIGATSVPGAITKGDIDLVVRVSKSDFPVVVGILSEHLEVKQPNNWTTTFASFGHDSAYELPLGVQVVVRDSDEDIFTFIRDYLISSQSALDEYNELKVKYAPMGSEAYWVAKNKFFDKVILTRTKGDRTEAEPGATDNPDDAKRLREDQ